MVPFSCVGINLAKTDEILDTDVPIDSAIVGMTANVFVNETAFVRDLLLFFGFVRMFCKLLNLKM